MKKEKMDILKEDIIIPDVVTDALESAYAKILEETAAPEQNGKVVAMKKKDRPGFKKKWIAVALVAVLAVGTLSVSAATDFKWYGLIKEAMFMTDAKEDAVEKYDMASVVGQSVTDNGVTITVEQTVCDADNFFVVLSIEGVEAPASAEESIVFEHFNISSSQNYGGEYFGVDEETGKLLYLWQGSLMGTNNLGTTLTMELGNLMKCNYKLEELWRVDGTWNFQIPIEGSAAEVVKELHAPTGNPEIMLEKVTLTPLSIEYETSYNDPEQMREWWDDPNQPDEATSDGFYGFLMKDGTIESAYYGGMNSSAHPGFTGRTTNQSYGTVIDLDQIEALLFDNKTDDVIPGLHDEPTLEDFVVVPLNE